MLGYDRMGEKDGCTLGKGLRLLGGEETDGRTACDAVHHLGMPAEIGVQTGGHILTLMNQVDV